MANEQSIRNIPRLGLSKTDVAIALGVSPKTVDQMVAEGKLPQPRRWHQRKFWRPVEIEACMAEWPVDESSKKDEDDWNNPSV